MSKVLKLDKRSEIPYPVGRGMDVTIPIVLDMVSKLSKVCDYENKYSVALLVRGSSGAILAGIVASLLAGSRIAVRVCHCKKEGEHSHSAGVTPEERDLTVILDDFVASGATVNDIHRHFKHQNVSTIDVLCVSGRLDPGCLGFEPKYIICGGIHN